MEEEQEEDGADGVRSNSHKGLNSLTGGQQAPTGPLS